MEDAEGGPPLRMLTSRLTRLSTLGGIIGRASSRQGDKHEDEQEEDGESESFYESDSDNAVVLLASGPPKIKLETLSARKLQVLLRVWMVAIITSFVLAITFAVLANTRWLKTIQILVAPNTYKDLEVFVPTTRFGSIWDISLCVFLSSALAVFMTIFLYRYHRTPRSQRLTEQILTIAFGFVVMLALIPVLSIAELATHTDEDGGLVSLVYEGSPWVIVAQVQLSLAGTFFMWYVWAKALVLGNTISHKRLYWVTAACTLVFVLRMFSVVAFKTVAGSFSFFSILIVFQAARFGIGSAPGEQNVVQFLCIVFVALFELLVILRVLYKFRQARRALEEVSYVAYRSKRILYWFYRANVIQLLATGGVIYAIQLYSTPIEWQKILVASTGINMHLPWQPSANLIVFVVYVLYELIAMFPASSAHAPFCWRDPPAELMSSDGLASASRLTFVRRERVSKSTHAVQNHMHSNTFVLETAVLMMNFCMYAYQFESSAKNSATTSTSSAPPPPALEELGESRFSLYQHIEDETTDTHVLILQSSDRIVASFRGTKSTENLIVDLKASRMKLATALENVSDTEATTSTTDTHDQGAGARMQHEIEEQLAENPVIQGAARLYDDATVAFSNAAANAHVHYGFGSAYRALSSRVMAAVSELRKTEPARLVYFTGHSLGGALATLASYHAATTLDLDTQKELICVTCGSPRVGDRFFQHAFEHAVPNCWRMVVSGDVITGIPGGRFTHVGTQVVWSIDGELVLDPSFIEQLNERRQTQSLNHHRMWSYRLAVQAWHDLYDADSSYTPFMWDFGPIPEDVADMFFSSKSMDKKRHVQLLHFRRQYLDENPEHQRLRFFRPDSIEISPHVADRWHKLILAVSASEQNVQRTDSSSR